jgi:hypothetical protein
MQDKPNPNLDEQKREIPTPPPSVGGDYIVVQGNIGPGASIGRGSVNAQNFAAGDMNITQSEVSTNDPARFAELLFELKGLLTQARQTGLDPKLVEEAIKKIDETEILVKEQQPPPKNEILKKLQGVADMINNAMEVFNDDTSVAAALLKALPVAVLLVKLAARLF